MSETLNISARDETTAATAAVGKDISREAAGTEDTTLLSLSLSSEHFSFVVPESENEEAVHSIDQLSQLFTGLAKKPPTLEEALKSMEYEKAKELAELFTKKATEKLKELDAPELTAGDVAAIFCYTFEWNEGTKKKFGVGESPYRKLNNSLSVNRSNVALKKTRGFLFLLLQALRKLPHFVPENHTLYRGLRARVKTDRLRYVYIVPRQKALCSRK